jgi:type IV secretory pathway VirB10-like protein
MIRYLPLALCLFIFSAWADLYKWTDENGKVHYSDQPPPGDVKKSESIKQPKSAAAAEAPAATGPPPPAQPKTAAELDMEFRKRRVEAAEAEAKAQKDAQAAEEKKRNCQRATAQVASLERGGRITRPGPNGEQTYMSDDEIAKEVISARKAADSWCK